MENEEKIVATKFEGIGENYVKFKPNGKIDIPFKKNHEIVKILEQKKIKEMNLKEIQKLLGKIN